MGCYCKIIEYSVSGNSLLFLQQVQGIGWILSSIIILTSGTIFMMWMGEQITEKGIGNGISLIIFIGIIARSFHLHFLMNIRLISCRYKKYIIEIIIFVFMVFIIAGIVLVTQGTRKIPVQYAKRVVGRKVYGGVTQYIPLRVNTAGVMPIIFAQSIMFIPSTVLSFFPDNDFLQMVSRIFQFHITYIFNYLCFNDYFLYIFLYCNCF